MTARLLANRDQEGLRRLLVDHGGKVQWTLRNEFHNVLDRSEIDDALSQATHRVWRFAGNFDPTRGSLRAWFYTIVRNCALRLLEAKSHSGLKFVDDLDAVAATSPLVRTSAAAAGSDAAGAGRGDASHERLLHDLHRCIDALPGQQRAVILADLAAGGIADTEHLVAQLETTPNSIYVSRTKARKALRAALEALGHPFSDSDVSDSETGALGVVS